MSFETLFALCNRIDILALECRITMNGSGVLDENAGNLLHGSFGWAMKEVAPTLWEEAYGRLETGAVRPLSMHPPASHCQWRQGDAISFGITLFNQLASDINGIKASLIRMGERGWGASRTGFTLEEISQKTPMGTRLIWSKLNPAAIFAPISGCLAEAMLMTAALCSDTSPTLVQLRARTRLHIKDAGKTVTSAPSALLLGKSICRRMLSLVGPHSAQEKQVIYSYLNGLETVNICWDKTYNAPLMRFSATQGQAHKIEGFAGFWGYQGNIQSLLPWLAVAQWVQLGNKTSFGYGAIDWQLGCNL